MAEVYDPDVAYPEAEEEKPKDDDPEIVYPEADPNDDYDSGHFSTGEFRNWQKMQLKTGKDVNFTSKKFTEAPNMCLGLYEMNIWEKTDYRVIANATKASADKFHISLDTWEDTWLNSAEATWIAFNQSNQFGFQTGIFVGEEQSEWIEFDTEYEDEAPEVVTFVTGFNKPRVAGKDRVVMTWADKVSKEGFMVNVKGEGEITTSWIAFSKGKGCSAYTATAKDFSEASPKTGKVEFKGDKKLKSVPTVAMAALSSFNTDGVTNLIIYTSVTDVTKDSLDWKMSSGHSSSGKSKVNEATMTYLVIEN